MHSHLLRRPHPYRALALTVTLMSAATLAIAGAAQASASGAPTAHAPIQPRSVISQSAAADTPASLSQCPQYSLCLWAASGYSSTFWHWTNSGTAHNTWVPLTSSENDKASSLYNDRDDWSGVAKAYPECQPNHNPTYCDDYYLEPPGNQISNFSGLTWPDGTSENDSISSVNLTTAS